ncbi:MAG: mannose-6-phosphate isomerase [Bacteroidetes bacterium]|nr:MAG: mannose-6-phosphate isomerase [Bacteroidota bacterium]
MNQLYPLKFTPVFKDKIWGGQKIKTSLGIDYGNLPNCGEAWMVSGVEGNPTLVSNGFLAGNELNELVEIYMGDLVGDKVYDEYGIEFPLLIKFIDANDWLSIQVHPDDELAAKRKIGRGKTEMWYILEADEEAQLIAGFNQKMNKEKYLNHLEDKTLKEILNFEPVKKGDVFYIPSGRVHALGPGILLTEIQQTSDTTYRIYDWDRIDAAGLQRELHTEEALDAIDFEFHKKYRTDYTPVINKTVPVVKSPYFVTGLITLKNPLKKDYEELDSFVIYILLEGSLTVKWEHGEIQMKKGETVVIPNALDTLELIPTGLVKLLEVYIP